MRMSEPEARGREEQERHIFGAWGLLFQKENI
jgi:hypothetical protein